MIYYFLMILTSKTNNYSVQYNEKSPKIYNLEGFKRSEYGSKNLKLYNLQYFGQGDEEYKIKTSQIHYNPPKDNINENLHSKAEDFFVTEHESQEIDYTNSKNNLGVVNSNCEIQPVFFKKAENIQNPDINTNCQKDIFFGDKNELIPLLHKIEAEQNMFINFQRDHRINLLQVCSSSFTEPGLNIFNQKLVELKAYTESDHNLTSELILDTLQRLRYFKHCIRTYYNSRETIQNVKNVIFCVIYDDLSFFKDIITNHITEIAEKIYLFDHVLYISITLEYVYTLIPNFNSNNDYDCKSIYCYLRLYHEIPIFLKNFEFLSICEIIKFNLKNYNYKDKGFLNIVNERITLFERNLQTIIIFFKEKNIRLERCISFLISKRE